MNIVDFLLGRRFGGGSGGSSSGSSDAGLSLREVSSPSPVIQPQASASMLSTDTTRLSPSVYRM